MPFGESISSAYFDALKDTLSQGTFLQVTRVEHPVLNGNANINLEFHRKFEEFKFPDGRTGRWWLERRLNALLREGGEYWKPMRRDGQWNYLIKTLKGIRAELFSVAHKPILRYPVKVVQSLVDFLGEIGDL